MKQTTLSLILLLSILGCKSNGAGSIENNKENEQGPVSPSQFKSGMVFHRVLEPNEHAFSFLAPSGWKVTGGITRVDPNENGGPANSLEAKLYMKLLSPDGISGIFWLPDTRFYDMQRCPTRNLIGNMFPAGSNYNGMKVFPILSPASFVRQIAFPFAHPHAQNVKITDNKPLPGLSEKFQVLSAQIIPGYTFNYTSALVTLEYNENNTEFTEKMVCVIEDYGELGAGMWGNKETWSVRTEKGKFTEMAPILATIGASIRVNPEWVRKEIKSQQINGQIALKTQQDIQRIEKEICDHRARTNSEINNDMYLNLTGQEDYTNPFSGETERGSNEWNYRWENDRGDIVYENNPNYDPNADVNIPIKGFKRSEIRKR
jgi:hypothetical protein